MDSEDKYIRNLLSVYDSGNIPSNFIDNVKKKIELEQVARAKAAEKREDIIQYIILSFSGIAIMVMLWLANRYYFKISITDIDFNQAGDSLKVAGTSFASSFSEFSTVFTGGNTLLWIVIAVNSLLLLTFYQFIEKKFYKSEKNHS